MVRPARYTQEMIDGYTSKGYWNLTTTSGLWDRNAALYPDEEALVDSRSRLTWAQVKLYSDRFALGLLELGLKKDEAIVMQLPNCVESFIVRLGSEKAGVICTTGMNTLRHGEMQGILSFVDAVGVVIPWQFRNFNFLDMINDIRPGLPALKHIFVIGDEVPAGTKSVKEMTQRAIEKEYPGDELEKTRIGPMEVAIVGTTSGTTGIPKLVERPMQAQILIAKGVGGQFNASRDDTILCGANVIAGLGAPGSYFGTAPLVGVKVIMLEIWDAVEAFKLIEKERPTVLLAVPPQLVGMVEHPDFDKYDLSSLRCILSATSILRYEVSLEWEKRTKATVIQFYGTFDAGGITGSYLDDSQEVRLRSIGRALPGNTVKIVDDSGREVPAGQEGEITVRGACIGSGYYKNPELTKETWGTFGMDGWYATGDLATLDEQGNVYIVGRKKDVIIRGGQNIYPSEIEDLLVKHPKVSAAAVVAMPDPVMGEKACAYVEPKPGEEFTFEEMISYLKGLNLASYKLPERLEVVDEMPRVRDGKIPKKLLREQLLEKIKAEAKVAD